MADSNITAESHFLIDKIVYGGLGLARPLSFPDETGAYKPPLQAGKNRGTVTFIPNVLPGETVKARRIVNRKGYDTAELIRIESPSPDRVHPPCPIFGSCGGCHLQHINPEAQAQYKQEMLREVLIRIGKIPVDPLPVISAPSPYHYRHRAQFKLIREHSGFQLAFFRRESHLPVPVENCLVLDEALNHALQVLQSSARQGLPFLKDPTELHVQYSGLTGNLLFVFFSHGIRKEGMTDFYQRLKASLPLAGLVAYPAKSPRSLSQSIRRSVWGEPFLMEQLKELTFRIGDRSFLQPNWKMNERMVDQVLDFAGLNGQETILDLYSGIGNFSLFLCRRAKHVLGIESNPAAVEDARYNARLNRISNIDFYCRSVENELLRMVKKNSPIDLILLDPPRSGAGEKVLFHISQLKPPRILYLSCEPSTLARDLKYLVQQRYRITRVQAFDLLPQTYHLEVLVELERP
jgi:23S rRNA (uracil1939-C5)-methyltransferase